MNGNEALYIEQLTVNYERNAVLWDIHCRIPQGSCAAILGPNGAGKSTLLKAAMGLIRPLSGSVLFFGSPLSRVRSRVSYVPQRASVDWSFPITALDLVLMGRYGSLGYFKWVSRKDKEAALQALAMVEMEGFAGRQTQELSGGQQQRLFIARALAQNADFYLMDEPFAGVDMMTEKALIQLFHTLRDEGKTLLIVHHDLASVEGYFDWTVLLNTCLITSGPTKEVFTQENIGRAYGRGSALLSEAASLVKDKTEGWR